MADDYNFDLDIRDLIDLLPNDANQTGADPAVGDGGGGTAPFDLNTLLSGINKLFQGTSPFGKAGAVLAAGGIGRLLEKILGGQQGPAGYQGGVPQYTATRTQMPYQTGQQNELLRLRQAAQDAMSTGATQDQVRNAAFRTYGISPSRFDQAMKTQGTYRRPGQGGITYFSPIQYTPTGRDLGAAPVTPATPTTGGTTGVGIDTGGSVATPGYTGPVVIDGQTIEYAAGGYMPSGIAMLAGGRYLRGPGDGVSDSIPAKFERSGQPARLADGEFVIDARTVSEIGNGSSEAGARKLYAMMDRVQKARKTAKRGKASGADKFLPK